MTISEKMIEAGRDALGPYLGVAVNGEKLTAIYTAMEAAREVPDDLAEEVARATYETLSIAKYFPWDDLVDGTKEGRRVMARAAIAATIKQHEVLITNQQRKIERLWEMCQYAATCLREADWIEAAQLIERAALESKAND